MYHILNWKPLHLKVKKHVIISSPITTLISYLMTLLYFKQIKVLLTSLADKANYNFDFFSHWFFVTSMP